VDFQKLHTVLNNTTNMPKYIDIVIDFIHRMKYQRKAPSNFMYEVQQEMTVCCNREGVCLLCSKHWLTKWNSS